MGDFDELVQRQRRTRLAPVEHQGVRAMLELKYSSQRFWNQLYLGLKYMAAAGGAAGLITWLINMFSHGRP